MEESVLECCVHVVVGACEADASVHLMKSSRRVQGLYDGIEVTSISEVVETSRSILEESF